MEFLVRFQYLCIHQCYSFMFIYLVYFFSELLAVVLSVCFCYELLFLLFKVFYFQFSVSISLFNYYFFIKF